MIELSKLYSDVVTLCFIAETSLATRTSRDNTARAGWCLLCWNCGLWRRARN